MAVQAHNEGIVSIPTLGRYEQVDRNRQEQVGDVGRYCRCMVHDNQRSVSVTVTVASPGFVVGKIFTICVPVQTRDEDCCLIKVGISRPQWFLRIDF